MSWRVVATLAIVGWGAFAFGAVYSWAFLPLFGVCAIVGAIELASPDRASCRHVWGLAGALTAVAAAIGLQLVPLNGAVIRALTPETDRLLRDYDVIYAMSPASRHALSVEPQATGLAVLGFMSLALFLFGSARCLSRRDIKAIVAGIIACGVVLALVGLIQKATWNGRIYWFWTPFEAGDSFGPFVNRNHFAGWMLMALPLAVGYFCARVAKAMQRVKPGWRNRVVWFASSDASHTVLIGFAIVVMATALVMSYSRSGILGLIAALIVTAIVVIKRQERGVRRVLAAVYLAAIVVVSLGWVGVDPVLSRFADTAGPDLDRRLGAWNDAWQIARRFPLSGTGINTYGVATLFYQTVDRRSHYAQAHNDYLQLAAEGGILVCVPVIAALVLFWVTVRKCLAAGIPGGTDYWIRIGAITGLCAVALQELGDFSLQMPGNAVLFCLLAAIATRWPAEEQGGRGSAMSRTVPRSR